MILADIMRYWTIFHVNLQNLCSFLALLPVFLWLSHDIFVHKTHIVALFICDCHGLSSILLQHFSCEVTSTPCKNGTVYINSHAILVCKVISDGTYTI